MLQKNQLNTLKTIKRKLKKLQIETKKDRDRKFFNNYFLYYKRYKQLYLETCNIFSNEEELTDFELNINQLSENEINAIAKTGKHDGILGGYLLNVSDYAKKLLQFITKHIVNNDNLLKSKAYLSDACNEKNRAFSLMEKKDWNGSVEASQHCIEHAIKSLFKVVGEQHPYEHDPTKEFKKVIEKLKTLPEWQLKYLARVRWIAKVWATVHEESMYAFYNIASKDFFNEKDARVLKDYAEEVYSICEGLVRRIEFKEFKLEV